MIFDLSKAEQKKYKAIGDGYAKLIAAQDALILKLRPDDPEPPKPKKPKKWTDAAREEWNEEINRLYTEWESAGSSEWREARSKRMELLQKQNRALSEYLEACFAAHFNALGSDSSVILEDAKKTVDKAIAYLHQTYETMRTTGRKSDGEKISTFSAHDVRATEDGFVLDAAETISNINGFLRYHIATLASGGQENEDLLAQLDAYIAEAISKSPYISNEAGKLGGSVKVLEHDPTEKKSSIVTLPKDYITTVDRISTKVFAGELVRPLNADNTALWDVGLDGTRDKVFARVAIDYTELLASGIVEEMPTLTGDDYNVHDAIITHIMHGNYELTYDMIYRAMTGKIRGNIKVSDDIRATIDEALAKFNARITILYSGKDKDGNNYELNIKNRSIIDYFIAEGKINGNKIGKVIYISRDPRFKPPLLEWAQFNRNELDTRDITLLDVPKLNNGRESEAIKMRLYRRLVKMRNEFDRSKGGKYELNENRRTIRYDYVYEALGLENPDANKRRLIKDKIDRCMDYWKKKGFIAGYSHRREKGGNAFYAVVVSFLEKKQVPPKNTT